MYTLMHDTSVHIFPENIFLLTCIMFSQIKKKKKNLHVFFSDIPCIPTVLNDFTFNMM